jgi:hypothetical protein
LPYFHLFIDAILVVGFGQHADKALVQLLLYLLPGFLLPLGYPADMWAKQRVRFQTLAILVLNYQ